MQLEFITVRISKTEFKNFNPTLVQLESGIVILTLSILGFQSHIGAIRISASASALEIGTDFNPTLVQLEFCRTSSLCRYATKFQSHIGAIRMSIWCAKRSNCSDFNPTLVQLECACWAGRRTGWRYFNPTLVQLECSRRNLLWKFSRISIPHWCN